MDRILEIAWKQKEKPFHAETIVSDDLIPISILRQILISIVGHCELYYPSDYCALYKFDDWHEHDGHMPDRHLTTFQDLRSGLESDESLYQLRHQDRYVYSAFYPDSLDFLCRYDILDENEEEEYPGIWGDFSFSGYGFDLWEITKRLRDYSNVTFSQQNSKEYFDKIYGG
jgi:hypothetical protein